MVNQNLKHSDAIILGGGTGGFAAALALAKSGYRVIVTEETDWIGGQLTSQAVPPDEHRWIEQFGCTATYREFRDRVRDYYKTNYPLTEEAAANEVLNPGNGWVSRICHEPKVALQVLEDMIAPYVNSGRVEVLYGYKPVSAETDGDFVTSITVEPISGGEPFTLQGNYFLDATECGDILPLAGVEFVQGSESRAETNEPHAAEEANPLDMQSITHVFALGYEEGKDYTIEKPEQYDFWREYVPTFSTTPILHWMATDVDNEAKQKEFSFFEDGRGLLSLWTYRRIIDKSNFKEGLFDSDVSLINWFQNDYYLGPIYGVSEEEREKHLYGAKQLSLSLVYWLQTEAPRPDGGKGWPGVRLRPDVMGTADGLAKYPYIRESRRIKAVYTITEHDVSRELRGDAGIKVFNDSVGVGSYYLDLHPLTVTQRHFYIPSYPYEIPLGSLLPVRVKNLLPACKNLGVTQITNGCYRLHPTEWNIGESAGYLAAYAMKQGITPHQVREDEAHLQQFQQMIVDQGVQIHWPEDIEL